MIYLEREGGRDTFASFFSPKGQLSTLKERELEAETGE